MEASFRKSSDSNNIELKFPRHQPLSDADFLFQLRAEALNALDLPISVKAGFLGSITLKVPWNRLGQEPVIVLLDRIFLIAEPYTGGHSIAEPLVANVAGYCRLYKRGLKRSWIPWYNKLKSRIGTPD